MLELASISAHYAKNQVLRAVDLKVAAGEVVEALPQPTKPANINKNEPVDVVHATHLLSWNPKGMA